MANVVQGQLNAEGKRFGIVVSRFNEFITKRLLEGALDCIHRHGGEDKNIDVVWVPGSFEIPNIALKMAQSQKYDAVVCLAAIIRGGTVHFEYIASEVTKGIVFLTLGHLYIDDGRSVGCVESASHGAGEHIEIGNVLHDFGGCSQAYDDRDFRPRQGRNSEGAG